MYSRFHESWRTWRYIERPPGKPLTYPPCIMCIQYIGDAQYIWGCSVYLGTSWVHRGIPWVHRGMFSTCIMMFPRRTEHPPKYLWYPPDVLNTHYTGCISYFPYPRSRYTWCEQYYQKWALKMKNPRAGASCLRPIIGFKISNFTIMANSFLNLIDLSNISQILLTSFGWLRISLRIPRH